MPEHQPPTAEEVASIRGILVETALPTAARPHEEQAPGDFDRLVAEVERLREHLSHYDVCHCGHYRFDHEDGHCSVAYKNDEGNFVCGCREFRLELSADPEAS